MRDIRFRVWYKPEQKMYFRGYQKLLYILLCDDDRGANSGRGLPVKRAAFEDCVLQECTDIEDSEGRLIYEGDCLRVKTAERETVVMVGQIPDMFRSRGIHPLQEALAPAGMKPSDIQFLKVTGNIFEEEKT